MNINAIKVYLKKLSHRPILQTIHYENDEMMVCNTYSLIIEKSIVKTDQPFHIDVYTMQKTIGTYPDISRIKPSNDILEEVHEVVALSSFEENIYRINDHHFDKDLVNKTLKCIDLDLLKIDKQDLKVSFAHKLPYLVYETQRHYVLIIGIRKDEK